MNSNLPKISIVTPSFNQGKYLEKTILSVLEQNYPNLEYIIIDGGSTDNSVEIIRKYEKQLTYWVSEKDRGQSHAINKGFERATGEIFGWLNSDDYYQLGAFQAVVESFVANDDAGAVVGAGDMLYEETGSISQIPPFPVTVKSLYGAVDRFFAQPSCFFSRRAWHDCGPLDESLHLAMDLDLWIRIAQKYRYAITDKNLSTSLVHGGAKTKAFASQSLVDACLVIMRHGGVTEGRDRLVAFLEELHDCRENLVKSHENTLVLLNEVENLTNQNKSLHKVIEEKEQTIGLLMRSLSWRLTAPLRWFATKAGLVQYLALVLIRNKHLLTLNNAKAFIRNSVNSGIGATFKESFRIISLQQSSSCREAITVRKLEVPFEIEESFPTEDVTVSVVIPTKNAGESFWQLLKMISNQRGIRDIEIIVVDSGSKDLTIEVAKEYGARVIEIPAESFSHSYARNLGAEHAVGDFLFFTVQDALIPSNIFFYELLGVYRSNGVIAVSCAEFPRADADLFYRFCCWNHYEFLGVNKADVILSKPEQENYLTLRKNGQLSDIACFIPRLEFTKYKYRFDYAEDLDLGIRLIKDGHTIAFLGSIKMIHSHNRPAFYCFKRGYVDQIFLTKNFSDYPISVTNPLNFTQELLATFAMIDHMVNIQLPELTLPCNASLLIERVKITQKVAPINESTLEKINTNDYIDDDFKHVLAKFYMLYNTRTIKDPTKTHYLLESINSYQAMIGNYLKATYGLIDAKVIEEYKYCIFKAFALISGVSIANMYLTDPEPTIEMLRTIGIDMKAGV